MATKTKSYGATFGYAASGTTYTSIGDIISIKPPIPTGADVDVSHLTSTDQVKEFLRGWIDHGEGTLMLYFTKTQFATLFALLYSGTDSYSWKVTLALISGESNASTLVFNGHIKSIGLDEINIDEDGKVLAPVTIRSTGPKMTFTAGT